MTLVKVKWSCLNGKCEYSTNDIDEFIDHLKEEHDIYIVYEIQEEG